MKINAPLALAADEVADIVKKHVEAVTGYKVENVTLLSPSFGCSVRFVNDTKMPEFRREWCCCFCLSVSDKKGLTDRPERCQHCHVVRCEKCHAWIKGDNPKWCHGCGTFMPKVEGAFVGTDQTACVYVEADWIRRNKGWYSDGMYCISTGLARDGSGRVSSWIDKEVVNEETNTVSHEVVRELTDEEKLMLDG